MIDWACVSEDNEFLNIDLSRSVKDKIKTPPLEAALNTVVHIRNNYPPPYTLLLSGGVDSQAMLYAWYLSNVPFNTYSARYNHNLNLYDLTNLIEFSNKFNINVNFYDFDLLNFLEIEHEIYTKKYLCGSPHITTHMKLASLVEKGTAIFSGNFIENNRSPVNANQAALYRYALKENKPLVPWFFLETEEIAYSFDDWTLLPKESSFLSVYDKKVYKYQYNKFPVIPQKTKYTGFELVKDYMDENPPRQPSVEDKFSKFNIQTSRRLFDVLYRNKYELKYNQFYKIKMELKVC